jgi:hypothetical protein
MAGIESAIQLFEKHLTVGDLDELGFVLGESPGNQPAARRAVWKDGARRLRSCAGLETEQPARCASSAWKNPALYDASGAKHQTRPWIHLVHFPLGYEKDVKLPLKAALHCVLLMTVLSIKANVALLGSYGVDHAPKQINYSINYIQKLTLYKDWMNKQAFTRRLGKE